MRTEQEDTQYGGRLWPEVRSQPSSTPYRGGYILPQEADRGTVDLRVRPTTKP